MSIPITLSWYELWMASHVGVKRHIEAMRTGKQDKFGCDPDNGWTTHIEGAAGEMAVAKALNRFYSGSINTFHVGGDVGYWQVRTRSRHDYELLVRPDDPDDSVFILVTGRAPSFQVRGWKRGLDAKNNDEWLKAHGGRDKAYFVPQNMLESIESLTVGT